MTRPRMLEFFLFVPVSDKFKSVEFMDLLRFKKLNFFCKNIKLN